MTTILHRGLRIFSLPIYFFLFLFGLLFPFFLWTFIFPFLFGLLFPFSLWTLISLFSLDFSLRIYSIEVTFWISSKFLIKPHEFWIWLAELWNSSNIYLVNFHFLFQKDKRIIGLRSVKMKKLWDTDYKHILHIIKTSK